MKNKLFVLLMTVLMLCLIFPFSINAETSLSSPTATLSLGEPQLVSRNGKDYITIDVNLSDNTAALYVISYKIMSKEKLVAVNFTNGTFEKTVNDGFSEAKLTLSLTKSVDPSSITSKGYTGVQVLQDSSSGTQGIRTKSGTLGTVWFEAPKEDGTYNFSLENLGCNSVYTDESGKLNIGTYNLAVNGEVAYAVGETTATSSLSPVCEEHNFTVDVEDGKKCEDCETVLQDDGTVKYPQTTDNNGSSVDNGSSDQNLQNPENKGNDIWKYVIIIAVAVILSAIIILTILYINKNKK
ncbi:MAG: hypothetical protein U0M42_09550 [Acutalibacteraceae bacterium]|nr:hypothetical protein [Acutalibacteraceae bacterium]